MSFASIEFIFYFLPLTILIIFFVEFLRWQKFTLLIFLIISLAFYAWHSIPHLLLLLALVSVTWSCGSIYVRLQGMRLHLLATLSLSIGLATNLGALFIWKYSASLVELWNTLDLIQFKSPDLILPLGISFYVLQQLGFLLDLRLGRAKSGSLLEYATFITFFPQLLSGPIVTYRHMIKEFDRVMVGRLWNERINMLALSVPWIIFGLFKKVVLSDTLSSKITPLMEKATNVGISSLEAWTIALACFPIIYFDFSGYSDIAVGLGLLLGVYLPYNFNAPHRSSSNRSGWQRWHITFHNFVRDHIYGPLSRRWKKHTWGAAAAIFVTFVISALWHGDSLHFMVWALLAFLLFIMLDKLIPLLPKHTHSPANLILRNMTVIILPLIFITSDINAALIITSKMFHLYELFLNIKSASPIFLLKFLLLIFLLIALNGEIATQVLLNKNYDHPERHFFGYRPPPWQFSLGWALILLIMFMISIIFIDQSKAFYYAKF